uniref:Glycine--tRNA ligase n=1 Tax=Romanomermis culicivorax TaxID=13658 RepID=A0A915L9F6_ROMCU
MIGKMKENDQEIRTESRHKNESDAMVKDSANPILDKWRMFYLLKNPCHEEFMISHMQRNSRENFTLSAEILVFKDGLDTIVGDLTVRLVENSSSDP